MLWDRGYDGDVVLGVRGVQEGVETAGPRGDLCRGGGDDDCDGCDDDDDDDYCYEFWQQWLSLVASD